MLLISSQDATDIIKDYYADYSKYVLETRALADIRDGLKTVQRRLIWEGSKFSLNSFTKAVNVLGNTVKIHPHGSESIYNSLVNITVFTNRLPLFVGHGNWGGFNSNAAASRYVSCKLAEHSRFNYTQYIDYANFTEGELGDEPSALPCLIPYALISGSEGIGVGFTAKVIPLDILELVDYYIDTIKGKKRRKIPRPDFGRVVILGDKKKVAKAVKEHSGFVEILPIITQEDKKTLVVHCLYKKNIDTIIKSLSDLIDADKVDFRNETSNTERYVFEIPNLRRVSLNVLRERLEKACKAKIHFKRLMTDGEGKAVFCNLDYVVEKSLEYLNIALDKKFSADIEKLEWQKEVYEALKYLKSSPKFNYLPIMSVVEVKKLIKKKFSEEIASEVVKKPLSYLTKDHDGELVKIEKELKRIKGINRVDYLVDLYKQYKEMVKPFYESREHSIYEEEL